MNNHVPIIDISALNVDDKNGVIKLAEDIEHAYSHIGFANIINHGIDLNILASVLEQSKLFFALPEIEKIKIKQNQYARGYVPMGGSTFNLSTLGATKKYNQSSGFILGPEIEVVDYGKSKFYGPNQWPDPDILPDFNGILSNYYSMVSVLMKKLIKVFSWILCKDFNTLDHYFYNPLAFLRLQHYPKQPDIIPADQYGIAPHTDYGALTLLATSATPGLQVKTVGDEWFDVPYVPEAFVLNTGDMMGRLSNNRLIVTPHRVINTSGKERYSVPFFFEPNALSCINPLVPKGDVALYEPINYEDYLFKVFQNNYNVVEPVGA
jgi:isopenicillin N synthase-like dioxygenase